MTPALRVLQVAEFEPAAAAIFQRLAEADYACSVHRVDSEAALRAALAEGGWDLVVARVGAQPLGADAALAVLQATGSDIAFVTICDEAQEAAGARLMKAGARAYVTLDRLARFVPIAEREMREAEFRRERQRAQLALQESEERYRRITEAITDYIVTVRLEGGRVIETRHGAACEVVTGYRAAEFIGNPLLWIAMVVDADRAAVEAHARRAAAGEPVPPIEHRIIRKDGAERWVRHTVVFHRDGAGRISGYDGLIQDITERKRTETALRESEEKFSRMFYLSPDMLSLSRLDDGRIIDVNEGFTAVTGYARDEVVGRRSNRAELSLWAHEEDRERFIAMLKAQGATAPVEGPFRRKDGRIGIGQVSGRIIHLDGVPCVLALTRDITEQRRRDGELRKLSQAVEQSPLSIVITDAAGSIEYVNSGFTRATGYTAAEALGQNPRVLKSGLEPASLYTELWRTISAGGEWRGEFRNRKKNGEIYVEDATISAVKDEAGHITHYLAAKEDITLRKQAEELSAEALAFQQTLMERIPVGIITYRANGAVVSVNEYVARLIGTTVEEVKRQNFRQLDSWRSAGLDAVADRALATGQEQQIEVYLVSSFGRHIWLDARFVPFRFGGEPHLLGIFNDVSERKAVEERREQTLELLHLCNRATDARDLVRELTLFFQRVTGCEAVGLRLREGSDLPSFETRAGDRPIGDRGPIPGNAVAPGGGASFIGSADAGNPERSGESSRPNFTKNGSFWTNGTTDLLAGFAPGKLPLDAPDACPKDGFESVASIPLRGRHGSIGLLQCSDRRKDRFTAEKIAFLETQADYVAIALTKLDSENALRASEEHLREVIESTEAGYFFVDTGGRFQQVNRAWLRLHGYDRMDEVIGQDISISQVEADLAEARRIVADLLEGRAMAPREFPRRRKDGTVGYHTFSAHAVRENGRTIGIEGFLIDTTSERSIRAEYQMLFEQMLDGFALHEMVFDAAGAPVDYRFLAINPAFEKMTGLKAGDTVGRRITEVMPGIERKWIAVYAEVVRTGEPRRFEDYTDVLGKHFEVVAFRPQPGRFACLVQDVTQRKQLEVQLLQAQKMEAIGQLAGGVAHDFNNILAATMMHLSLLQMESGLKPEIRISLKELENETKRAANLTRQLLMFSRRQAIHVQAVELNEILADLLKMLRRLIGENIDLVFAGGCEAGWIDADASMIEQVIINLCVNARDAMPDGGRLSIGTAQVELAESDVVSRAEARAGRFLCLTISDTGCGMDEATLKRIFEPFFTTKEVGKGTGLGLATVYGIVKQHHGWVDVESVVGQGTTFRIFLPERAGFGDADKQATAGQIPGGTETVLVVEDDASLRRMVVGTLRVLGYRVWDAANGKEAMILWKTHRGDISLLFTDMVMPEGMSGLALAERFRRDKPMLRVILSSGYSEQLINLNRLDGADLIRLPKPYTAENLAEAVRKCIDQQ